MTLVQEASTLDPADNRDAAGRAHSRGQRPRGLPRGVRPRLRRARLRPQRAPPSRSTARSPSEVARVAAERGTTVLAGMFEHGDDPARPANTLVLRGVAHADYRKIHLYDSFGYRESDRVTAGPLTPVVVDLAGLAGRADDLLRPALPRAGPGAGRRRRRGARGARRLGGRARARSTTGPRWPGPGRSRTRRTSSAVGQPGPRYTGHSIVVGPLGEVLAEAGEKAETLTVTLERGGRRRRAPHQPVAGQPPPLTRRQSRYPSRPCRPPSPAVAPSDRRVGVACGPAAASG